MSIGCLSGPVQPLSVPSKGLDVLGSEILDRVVRWISEGLQQPFRDQDGYIMRSEPEDDGGFLSFKAAGQARPGQYLIGVPIKTVLHFTIEVNFSKADVTRGAL